MERIKSKFMIVILTMLMIILSMCPVYATETSTDLWKNHAADSFAGGNGTSKKPFQISNAAQLAYLSNLFNDKKETISYRNKYFQLTNDIDLSTYLWNPIGSNGANTGKTIYFQGYFDGNEHTISGVRIQESQKPSYAGLFGYVKAPTDNKTNVIKNLVIKDAKVEIEPKGSIRTESYVGLLAAYTDLSTKQIGIIHNIKASGEIIRGQNVQDLIVTGGLIGYANKTMISNCQTEINITGKQTNRTEIEFAGGLIGALKQSTIEKSISKGKITGSKQLGGLVVDVRDSKITQCSSYVNIKGNNQYIGGLLSISTNSIIQNCASFGNVESLGDKNDLMVGGLIGNNSVDSRLEQCYFVGSLSGAKKRGIGSFAGSSYYGESKQCFYDGTKNSRFEAIGNAKVYNVNDIKAISTEDILKLICENVNAHDFSDWKIEKEMTCTKDGLKSRDCKNCKKHEESIIKAQHDIVKVEAKKPSKTENGHIEYWYCKRCERYFKNETLTQEISKDDVIILAFDNPNSNEPSQGGIMTGDNVKIIAFVLFLVVSSGVVITLKKKKIEK